MKNEPLVTVATITALVGAVLGLLVAFGVPLTGDQQTAVLGIATVAAPLLVALFARPKVTPVNTLAAPAHAPVTGGHTERGESALTVALVVLVVVVVLVLLVPAL